MNRREMLSAVPILLAGGVGANSSAPPRKTVIPNSVIQAFQLRPAESGALSVLGEDGKYYALDDALAVLFLLLQTHVAEAQQEQNAERKLYLKAYDQVNAQHK